jgi:lysozyme family protein
MNNFISAFNYMIVNEGINYTDIPGDLGGPTKFGITLNTLSSYLGVTASALDVENLTEDVAQAIYLKNYWTPLCCDKLPVIIATALFDCGVNRGPQVAIKLAQQCIGGLVVDGIIGPKTISTLNSTNQSNFIYKFMGALQSSYVKICISSPSQLEFLEGWLARARRLFTLVMNG